MCYHHLLCHKQGATEGADAVLSEGGSAGRRCYSGSRRDPSQVLYSPKSISTTCMLTQFCMKKLSPSGVLMQSDLYVFCSKLEVTLPDIDYIEIPTIWWDAEADKSLLIGVHKHGETSSKLNGCNCCTQFSDAILVHL